MDPGAYSIFVVPGETSWDVTLNGVVERWGIPIDESVHAADVATFQLTPEALEESVEALTMRFETAADGTHLVAEWEMTRIRIPIRVLQG